MTSKHTQSGFTLLISLIVVAVIITIGMSILDLSIKQVRLASNAKESEIAFHAANAGMECARFVRQQNSDDMETGASITPNCFNASPDSISERQITTNNPGEVTVTGDGEVFQYEYTFTWGAGTNNRCTKVNTVLSSSSPLAAADLVVEGMNVLIPGYPEDAAGDFLDATPTYTKTCEPGARCTVISVQGYNQPCSNISGFGVIQREVLLQF